MSVFASLYPCSLHASDWDTTTKWADIWEQQKSMPMQRDSTIGPEYLIGYVPLRPIALLARIINQEQSIGMKFQKRNGKTKQYHFALCTLITRDLFTQLLLKKVHCLLIIDAFSRFLMVYPVRNTTALGITAVEKWILSFGISHSIIHDRGTAFINTEFVNWTKGLGITLRPRAA